MKIFSSIMLATILSAFSFAKGEVPPIRLAYNYCTLSYTFAYYSDEEWDAEIERLADRGYNVALVIDGTFKVWQQTLRSLGYSEEEIFAFIPDECARAWWLMGNLTGEGGPLDQKTIDEDAARGRRICAKMREKGIEPILQGFTGMMPLGEKYGALQQGKWACYERPPILNPTSEAFYKISKVWYRELEKVYGFKPKYLAGDLFHEGGKIDGVDVTAATREVQAAQQRAFPGVIWVVQAWQANPTLDIRAGLDPRFTLIEALVKDMGSQPAPKDFGPLPWVWCEVLNFGGNHGLYGNLRTFANLGKAADSPTFRGYGSLSEGFFTNPICYDLFDEMMMRPKGSVMNDEELANWVAGWIDKRYNIAIDKREEKSAKLLHEAWNCLAKSVYACPYCQEGTVENVLCARPSWQVNNVSAWGPRKGLWYEPAILERALECFEEVKGNFVELCGNNREAIDNFAYDFYDIKRQVRANRLRKLAPNLKNDKAARDEFIAIARKMANEDGGAFGVPEEFSLDSQLRGAYKRAGVRGVKAFLRMITTWADEEKHGRSELEDYANREYRELIELYYLKRWEKFL